MIAVETWAKSIFFMHQSNDIVRGSLQGCFALNQDYVVDFMPYNSVVFQGYDPVSNVTMSLTFCNGVSIANGNVDLQSVSTSSLAQVSAHNFGWFETIRGYSGATTMGSGSGAGTHRGDFTAHYTKGDTGVPCETTPRETEVTMYCHNRGHNCTNNHQCTSQEWSTTKGCICSITEETTCLFRAEMLLNCDFEELRSDSSSAAIFFLAIILMVMFLLLGSEITEPGRIKMPEHMGSHNYHWTYWLHAWCAKLLSCGRSSDGVSLSDQPQYKHLSSE